MKFRSIILITKLILASQFATAQTELIIKNAHIVDVIKGNILINHTVIISGDRITKVTADTSIQESSSATTIDAGGKYLLPGLWDMHMHSSDLQDLYPLFVATGVTGIWIFRHHAFRRKMAGQH